MSAFLKKGVHPCGWLTFARTFAKRPFFRHFPEKRGRLCGLLTAAFRSFFCSSFFPYPGLRTFPFIRNPEHLPGNLLFSQAVTSSVPSAAYGLTAVFGMGTRVAHKRIVTGNIRISHQLRFLTVPHARSKQNSHYSKSLPPASLERR